MPKAHPIQNSFNAGELSPTMDGRTDVDKYLIGGSVVENFIPMIEGPITRRPGTYFVAEVKDHADGAWLAKFEFNVDQAYILEFGDQYIRFYTNDGVVLNLGIPYEISTPWTWADLFNADSTFALQMVQSADVIYIVGGGKSPRKLSRIANTNWTLTEIQFNGGPFEDVDPDQAITVYASAQTGSGITLTASAALFNASHVGSLFYFEQKAADGIAQWEVGKAIAVNALRRSDGNVYKALNSATTGSVKPVHTVGAKFDGDTGVQWQYQHSGYGWAKITAFTSSTVVTADVVSLIPDQAVGSGNATNRWAFQTWNGVDGYPTSVTFFRERLVMARDDRINMSVVGDYENFSARDGDQVVADMAISMTLASSTVNEIQWMTAVGKDLIAGTTGGEFTISSLTDSSAFGPANKEANAQVGRGSRAIQPVLVEDSLFYVQRNGRRVWELKFEIQSDGYVAGDKMTFARHIAKTKIVAMAYQREPFSVLWCVTETGKLIAATIGVEQGVIGWHRHPVGGNGVVESVAVIPSPDGGDDQLWLVVKRTIDGAEVRYVERMVSLWDADTDDIEDLFLLDCGLTYNGAPATSITGLGHLEGETVSVWADGAVHPNRTVTSGAITLQAAASVVHVGLGYSSKWRSMRPEAGSTDGTAQGKTKRAARVMFRLLNSLGGKFGPNENALDELDFRSTGDLMDTPVPLFTGDIKASWPDGYSTDGYMWFVVDQPTPSTLVAVMPRIATQDS